MHKSILPFSQVPQLSKSDVAYATGDARLSLFYSYAPDLASFEQILLEKERVEFPRADLVKTLTEQYQSLPKHEKVSRNIEALGQDNAFTIVTAHQPSLFLGPLYFVYKALTAINLAEAVEARSGGIAALSPFLSWAAKTTTSRRSTKSIYSGKKSCGNPARQVPWAAWVLPLWPLPLRNCAVF
jgi:hypothetical protein